MPWLYLKGISTNDFREALQALFGESVKGLSATSVARLKGVWEREYAGWRERDWGGEEFVYLWADGIYVNVRGGERRCLLVVVGCDARGRKRFLALEAGFRESKESWKAVLLSLRDRGVKAAKLAVGDGGSGSGRPWPKCIPRPGRSAAGCTRRRTCSTSCPNAFMEKRSRCCMRYGGSTPARRAHKAFGRFFATWEAKYPKAADSLERDREASPRLLRLLGGALGASADDQPH